ncbi:hypothetical protein LCGC14_3120460 [marine sediment metagenome]|uniref:Uncharacterized protein n=1 Tax=marine sediment metagenome TaxID=412755 RepID=A0A0F8Y9Y6_9ZZZZ
MDLARMVPRLNVAMGAAVQSDIRKRGLRFWFSPNGIEVGWPWGLHYTVRADISASDLKVVVRHLATQNIPRNGYETLGHTNGCGG